jgi:hypothetical protein
MHQTKYTDNLKHIKGIGPVKEKILHEAGISSFADLAKRSPKDLADLVPSLSTKQTILKDWIREAKKLSPEHYKNNRDLFSSRKQSRQRYATFNLELLLDTSDRVRRTRIVHVQTGKENQWAEWDDPQLINFIAHQAHTKLPSLPRNRKDKTNMKPAATETTPDTTKSKSASADNYPTVSKSKIIDIQTCSILINNFSLHPNKDCMRAQLEFKIIGSSAQDVVTRSTRYFVTIFACDLLTAHTNVMTSLAGMFQANQLDYKLSLEFPTPQVGRYQMEAIVFLPEQDIVTIQLGPILTTIP